MIDRRTFLKWGTAAPVFLSSFTSSWADTRRVPQNTIVVMDGVGPDTDADRLAIVLNAFAQNGLPVSCLVETLPKGQRRLTPEHQVSQLLRKQREALPGLFEVLPVVPDLGLLTPYFQARAVYHAKTDLFMDIWGDIPVDFGIFNPQSIACDFVENPRAPSGVRASGIRNVLMRVKSTIPVRPEAWDDGVLRMIGGRRVQLGAADAATGNSDGVRVERVFYLSALEISQTPLARLNAAAMLFSTEIQHQGSADWSSPILASDIQFRDAYGYQRNMGLHFFLDPQASSEDRNSVADLRLDLIGAGIPSSFGSPAGLITQEQTATGYWIDVEGMKRADSPIVPLALIGTEAEDSRPRPGIYGMGVQLSPWNEMYNAGVDPLDRIRIPAFHVHDAESASRLVEGGFGTGDFVVVVSPSALRNRPLRSQIKDALLGLADDGITSTKTVPHYVRTIVPTGPYLSHFRRTVSYAIAARPNRASPDAPALYQYMQDAKIAWNYFER